MAVGLHWRSNGTPEEIAQALRALAEEYPLFEGAGEPMLEFVPGAPPGRVEVSRQGGTARMTYGTVTDALRGVGALLAGMPEAEEARSEVRPFSTFGVMLDCSRNAVMEVPHLKRWLRRMSLLGFNLMMLYTEDTYKLPGEPFFGYMRGGYSPEDLKELDDYAARLGIEMIGCIQTLGHMRQMLGRRAYEAVRDTPDILRVGEPATYDLIRKMIANYAACFRSRRIHVGMDEAHDLGRGKYLDLHGYRRPFDIFNEHLSQVVSICRDHGLRPMIWSDMYFRMGSKTGDYYDKQAVIPEEVRAAIPAEAELVYWDYYHNDEQTYRDFIRMHRQLGKEPIMGSGVWSWYMMWYGRAITERNVAPCVRACKQEGVKEIFFTLWGDDGGYCEYDSTLAGLAFAAAQAYGEDGQALRARYQAVCGIGYEETVLPCKLGDESFVSLMWDDPLMGINWRHLQACRADHWPQRLAYYRDLAQELAGYRRITEPVDLGHAAALAELAAAKIDFRLRLERAYFARDRAELERLIAEVPRMVSMVEEVTATFRRQWLRRNRPLGLEVMQTRMGGMRQRYLEVGELLRELLDGRRRSILELEEGAALPQEALAQMAPGPQFRLLASSSVLGP